MLSANDIGAGAVDGTMGGMAAPAQKPLELILARNLLTSLSTPAFLVDENAALVFYNEAAGALLGPLRSRTSAG